jgi:hypothetical protein
MAALRRARVNNGTARLAFGALTGTNQTLLPAVAGRGVILYLSNSLNAETIISLDGGATDFITLQSGQSLTIDFAAAGAEYSGAVSVRHTGSAPTSGAISAGVVRVE